MAKQRCSNLCIAGTFKSHLRAACDGAGGKTNRRSPANISHPITVSLQLLILLPLTVLLSARQEVIISACLLIIIRMNSVDLHEDTKYYTENQSIKIGHSLPEFDEVVASSGDEAFDVSRLLSRRLIDQTARNYSRSPTHCVTANLQ